MSRDLLLVFLAARSEVGAQFNDFLAAERERWSAHGEARAFLRLPEDPFVGFAPGMRGFDATLELRCGPDGFRQAISGFGTRADSLVQRDLCAVVAGTDHEIVAGGPSAVLFHYLMRRRHDLDHDQFVAHYGTVHADIGRRTPGTVGYSQVHAELSLSRQIASSEGMGVWQLDSVSRLWLSSVEEFLGSAGAVGQEAIEDERSFMDGANSVMFASAPLD